MGRYTVVAVCGHESEGGQGLEGLLGPEVPRVTSGRALHRHVSALRGRDEDVYVVPMTLGRDPDLVADAGRTLLNLSADERAGVVLTEPFGTRDHVTGWLRAAAGRVAADSALLVTAPSGDPFADADLFRTARLVRQYGRHRMVEVALIGGDPDPAEGVRRCRALGAREVVLLPAAWVRPPLPDSAHHAWGGPLLPASAVAGVLRARVREAKERHARYGDDGVARGIEAAHGHGYAHSHGPGDHDGHSHSHGPEDHGGHSHGDHSHPHHHPSHHHAHGPGPRDEAPASPADDEARQGDHPGPGTDPVEVPCTAEELSHPTPLVLPYDLPVHRSLR